MLFELVEDLLEHGQALCATVAGGCGQAEALLEHREMLFELVESLREHGQTLCASLAGGCGHAEALDEFGKVLFELVEDLWNLRQALCASVGVLDKTLLTLCLGLAVSQWRRWGVALSSVALSSSGRQASP
jgi:hypothetical protein